MDLDGTLTDSKAGIAVAVNHALMALGFSPAPLEEHYQRIGLPLREMFLPYLPPERDDLVAEAITIYRAFYLHGDMPLPSAFPGVSETLTECRRSGATLILASSKITPVAIKVLAGADLRHYFDLILGSDSVTLPKPHPEMVLAALTAYHCPPMQAIMVGDTTYAILMAKAAGIASCAVTYGVHTRAELAAVEPTYLIDHFSDLLTMLGAKRKQRL